MPVVAPIVRIPNDLVLDEQLKQKINDTLGVNWNDGDVVPLLSLPDFFQSYSERFKTIYQSFNYFVEHAGEHLFDDKIPEARREILALGEALAEQYSLDIAQIDEKNVTAAYQALLNEYVAQLLVLAGSYFPLPQDRIIHYLGEAENFLNLKNKNTRPDLLSISPLTLAENTYTLVQYEQVMPSLSDKMRAQFWSIKQRGDLDVDPSFFSLDLSVANQKNLYDKLKALDTDILKTKDEIFLALKQILTDINVDISSFPESVEAADRDQLLAECELYLNSFLARQLLAKQDCFLNKLSLFERQALYDSLEAISSKAELEKQYPVLRSEIASLPQMAVGIDQLWALRERFLAHPEWYRRMDPLEKVFLDDAMAPANAPEDLDRVFHCLSSKHRSLPVPANHTTRHMLLLDNEGNILVDRKSRKSSMVSSRDVRKQSQAIRDFHTVENIYQILFADIDKTLQRYAAKNNIELVDGCEITLPYLIQTLISPMSDGAIIGAAVNTFIDLPDKALYEDKLRAIDIIKAQLSNKPLQIAIKNAAEESITVSLKLDFISTNHPQNSAKLFSGTGYDDEGCLHFIDVVKAHLERVPDEVTAQLLDHYEHDVLKCKYIFNANWSDPNGRELFLSSLEQNITQRIGGLPYGSCVSAKDRKSLELIHSDSCEIYKALYGDYPKYTDKDEARARFVEIFAHLYLTRHVSYNAAQNANGCDGIKTPNMYLPKDIQLAIKALQQSRLTPLKDDDTLASNNEIHDIVKHFDAELKTNPGAVLKNAAHAVHITQKNDLAPIIAQISKLLQDTEFWAGKKYYQTAKNMAKAAKSSLSYMGSYFTWKKKSDKEKAPSKAYADLPTGIRHMKRMLDMSNDKNALDVLVALYDEVVSRGEKSEGRSRTTDALYEGIKACFLQPMQMQRNLERLQAIELDIKELKAIEHWESMDESTLGAYLEQIRIVVNSERWSAVDKSSLVVFKSAPSVPGEIAALRQVLGKRDYKVSQQVPLNDIENLKAIYAIAKSTSSDSQVAELMLKLKSTFLSFPKADDLTACFSDFNVVNVDGYVI